MARLPDVSTQGERPTPRPATGIVSYQADMGGGQAPGMALAQAGETLQQIGAQFQEKADTTRVEDAWNQYKNAALDLTVGENGLLKKQAGDAVNSNMLQTAGKTLGRTRAGIESMLTNDNQRRRFAERANVTDLETKQQIISHMATQQAAYDKQVMMGSEGAANAQITAAPMSPDVFQQARDTLMAQADAFLTSNGVTDKKARTEYKDKVSDTLWATRIDALLYDKPLLADAIFRANEKEIKNPEMKLQFQAKTREASMSVRASMEAQAAIDEVRKAMPPAAGRGPEQPFTPGPTDQIGISDDGTPRSLRNNNPGNIKKSSVQWQGQLPGGDATFVSFATPEDGMRALQQNLITYQDKHGLNTPAAIISRWAPAKENGKESTDNYINHVAESLGVKPNDKIDLHDQATLQRVSVAIARFEAGGTGSRAKQDPLAVNTSGLPTARDVGAQLPIIMGKVEKTATRLYGPDQTNPDRAAFVRRMGTEVQAKLNADVHQLNAIQRQAQGALIDAITGLSAPTPQDDGTMKVGGAAPARALITSFGQIQANPTLMRAWQMMDPQAKLGIERLLEHNARDAAKGGKAGDEVLYRDLWNRVHLPPGDPKKIEFYGQITDPAIADRLSISQIGQIRLEIDRNETPGGRSLNQMRKAADADVHSWFATNKGLTTYGAYPEKAIAANMRWNEEVGKKVDAYVAAGQPEKVRLMFQLDTPESVIKPEYLQTFVDGTPAQGLAEGAAKAAAATAPIAQPANIDTREKLDAWFQTLPSTATSFTGADGKIRAIPGRAAQPASTAVPVVAAAGAAAGEVPGAPAAAIQPAPAAAVTTKAADFKIVTDPEAEWKYKGEQARQIRELTAQPGWMQSVWEGIKAPVNPLAPVGEAIGSVFPTHMENVYASFQAIKRMGTISPSDVDILREVLKYGQLPADDEALARGLLKRIGKKK